MLKILLRLCVLVVAFGFFCAGSLRAQTSAPTDDNDTWHDIVLTAPLSAQFDFFAQGTFRFDQNSSRLYDRRIAVGLIYKPTKYLSISPFYWDIEARNAAGRFRVESRLNLRAVYRFPFKQIGLSHRSWYEYRERRPRNSWRYRPALTIEKELSRKILHDARVYLTEEVFYDSILEQFSRNRVTLGVNKTFNQHFALDVYYLRQNDGFSRPGDLNVFGTSWRLRP